MLKLTISILLLCTAARANPIHEAAKRNDCLAALKILRQDPSQLNARDESHGNTPLHWAAYKGNLQMVRLLVEQGAKVDARTKEGYTPLRDAAYKHQFLVYNYLSEHGADQKVRDNRGATISHWAAAGGYLPGVQLPPNVADCDGLYPADWAAQAGHQHETAHYLALMVQADQRSEVARFLQRHPDYVDARLHYGEHYLTPLCYARSAEMAEVLLSHGAKVNALVDEDGDGAVPHKTPLHMLARSSEASVLKVLLRYGADPRSRAPGYSPLYFAALGCNVEATDLLIRSGADVNLDALLFAVGYSRDNRARAKITDQQMIDTARLLVNAGANLAQKNRDGLTAEAAARANHNPALANFLAKAGH